MADRAPVPPLEEPLAQLERRLIHEFLNDAGQDETALRARTDDAAKGMLRNAAIYAGNRLAEVECRSHYVRKLHGAE
jgi:hypothetical protein